MSSGPFRFLVLTTLGILMTTFSPVMAESQKAAPEKSDKDCMHCKFKNADLKGKDYKAAHFAFSNFEKADLKGANLAGSDLRFTEMQRANMEKVNLEGSNLTGARIRNVSFESGNLKASQLIYADLFAGNFKKSDLTGANLTGANLISADFTDADLTKADLSGAAVASAKFKNTMLCETIMPDGSKYPRCEKRNESDLTKPNKPPKNNIPKRSSKASSGSAFIKKTQALPIAKREDAMLKELLSGNIPDFLRNMKPLVFELRSGDQVHYAQLWVMTDYLSIGSNKDFVRVPLNPLTARKVAEIFDMELPTARLVDEIYMQADVQLSPSTMKWGKQMRSSNYFVEHNKVIESSLKGDNVRDLLIAGHKKDVIVSNMLTKLPGKVAIYGWHLRMGEPIQRVCITHNNQYADYSHGVRLISSSMLIDGKEYRTRDVLANPEFSSFISDEGPLSKKALSSYDRPSKHSQRLLINPRV